MGADQSKAIDEVEKELDAGTPEASRGGTQLYKFVSTRGGGGGWERVSHSAHLSIYDANEGKKKHDWCLEIEAGGIDSRIDESMQILADEPAMRITFCTEDEDNGAAVWALKFPSTDQCRSWHHQLQDKLFYNTYGVENDDGGRAKALGEDYASLFFNSEAADMEVQVDEPALDEPAGAQEYRDREDLCREEGDESICGVVMGANENTFLVRGTHFDVLRNVVGGVEDKGVSFAITPPPSSKNRPGGGAGFTPSRVLLTGGESKMMLLSPLAPNSVYQADIEYGKIISEWSFQKDQVEIPMDEITHESRDAQLDDRSTFLGLAKNRLCKWDLRDARGVVDAGTPSVVNYEGGKDYARGTNFSCMATSGDGYVAVGATDGKLRLYGNKQLTKANTAIPGLGSPITAVDVTFDGRWVVATTDNYLLVVNTIFTSKGGQVTNGFKSPMGKSVPLPRVLRLKAEDVARTGNKPFRSAKFTWVTEAGRKERWIVASCGSHSVVWNLKKVQAAGSGAASFGGLPTSMDYFITGKDEDVVDASFMHERYAPPSAADAANATSLVVATGHRVFSLAGED